MNRKSAVSLLKSEQFDLCIIGGGASGTGCALDAALRGYKVALIDQEDFAGQTSSRSTKLIHGGVRYLDQAFKKLDLGQLKQVRHGLQERHIVLSNAPHLARPLPLLTPVNSWLEGLYFTIGLRLYDQFAVNDSLPKSKWLNKKEVLQKMPTLNKRKLHSAVQYYDGQLDDARYCLALAQSAADAGAVAANYVQVQAFQKDLDGKLQQVVARDMLTEEDIVIHAAKVINCTGPFADSIRQMANPSLAKRLRPSKGVHISLPAAVLNSSCAMLIPKTSDGRVVFAIPFEGVTMLGTTDTEYTHLDQEPLLTESEKKYLADTLSPYLEKPVSLADIQAGFGGLRPLLSAQEAKSTKTLVRDHEVEVDSDSGLVSLLGGKWTTYRLMAKDAIDEVDRQLGHPRACTTERHILKGGNGYSYEIWEDISTNYGLEPSVAQHLAQKYGMLGPEVAQLAVSRPEWKERIHPEYPFILAEIPYCVRHEMVVNIRDYLARRTRLELLDWNACLQVASQVGQLIGEELDWSPALLTRNVDSYRELIKGFIKEAGLAGPSEI
ncbi:glycerol-3-phosphate dehydrogenase [Dyadobacter jejuensis]|uniref:Glycerol-3-phosphate dehydrogenase n=1 Tax=Dyadobacter jejuensis TaxID=1082580 RepID=A0A316AMM9_9BACT|nr:FAD-dependent oxidoreductase [Dyadobacter jejuensis]PWJ58549.1 glycerol-3-phosphate dehydrogenase [Dyadobacter jejuensis]